MKTKAIKMILVLMIISISSVFAQGVKTEKITVNGKCGMCETRIEKAALSVDGISKAEWDIKTQVLVITYDETKTSSEKIQKKIALVGHDTEMFKADNKIYNALPGCCKYR